MSSSGTWALRSRTVLAAIALALGSTVVVAQVRTYEMPAKPLSQALRDYGRIAAVQIIFTDDLVRGRTAPRSEEHTSDLQPLMRVSYAVICLNKQHKHVILRLIQTVHSQR